MQAFKTFKTLLLREWMQHRFGWSLMVLVPFALTVLAVLVGDVEFDAGETMPDALALATIAVAGLGMGTLLLGWVAAMLQAPGLARRDQQDRSIEFWLSLPTSHHQSLGATLLAHLVLWPCAALLGGVVGGLVASLPLVAKTYGLMAWFSLPWLSLLAVVALGAMRLMLGVALATLWLSPLILLVMATSVWLKRWALPVVVAVFAAGGAVLQQVYGNPIVWRVLRFLGENANQALIAADRTVGQRHLVLGGDSQADAALSFLPAYLVKDAGLALLNLAQPGFVLALLAAGAAYAVLWFHRQRGA